MLTLQARQSAPIQDLLAGAPRNCARCSNPHGKRWTTNSALTGITCAVPSPDSRYIAAIASSSEIHIRRCFSRNESMLCYTAVVSSKHAQTVLAHAKLLRWSPEVTYSTEATCTGEPTAHSENTLLRAWLLVSDEHRLVALCIDLNLPTPTKTSCTVLGDFDLGKHLGRFSFADFVFSHEYAIVLQAAGVQASLLSLTRPERHDIANIKYSDSRGLALSHNNRYFSILTRSDGQDLVFVFTIIEMGSVKSNSFSSLTYDAQGVKWCPNGDPLLCVWDSASFELKVSFFTANGHHLRQMDLSSKNLNLPPHKADFEGLGANSVDWPLCCGTTVLAVFNSSGRLFLRRGSGSDRVCGLMPSLLHTFMMCLIIYSFTHRFLLLTTKTWLMVRHVYFGRSHKRAATLSLVILHPSNLAMSKGWLVLISLP